MPLFTSSGADPSQMQGQQQPGQNYGILQPQQAPKVQVMQLPQSSGGGLGDLLGGIKGLLGGLGKAFGGAGGFAGAVNDAAGGSGTVSQVNSAVSNTLSQMPQSSIASSVLPSSQMAAQSPVNQAQQPQQPNPGTALNRYQNTLQAQPAQGMLAQVPQVPQMGQSPQTPQAPMNSATPGQSAAIMGQQGINGAAFAQSGQARMSMPNPQAPQVPNAPQGMLSQASPNLMGNSAITAPTQQTPTQMGSMPNNAVPGAMMSPQQQAMNALQHPQTPIQNVPGQGNTPTMGQQTLTPSLTSNSFGGLANQSQNRALSTQTPGSLSNPNYGNPNAPLSERNNNFGNIKDPQTGQFMNYKTPEEGLQAQSKLIDHYGQTGRNTPESFIKGNGKQGGWSTTDQNEYINNIANAAGVKPNEPMNLSDPGIKSNVMQAIMKQEGGKAPYSADEIKGALSNNPANQSITQNVNSPQAQVNSVRNATQAAQSGDYMQVAKSYMGEGRANHPEVLNQFFSKSMGQNVNIQNTPWCAGFANSVLMSTGHGGTGSLAARSFLNYGTPTTNPTQGDIAVLSRGVNSAQGHVGFVDSISSDGKTVNILGGNESGQVMVKGYPTSKVLGYRTPPTAQELQSKYQGSQQSQQSPLLAQQNQQRQQQAQQMQQQGLYGPSLNMPQYFGGPTSTAGIRN